MTRRPAVLPLLLLAVIVSVFPRDAFGTWSIVAVDPETREVGAAAASCTVGVELIHAVSPGRGAMLAQAATNFAARDRGVAMIADGASPQQVIDVIATEAFNPGRPWQAPWREQQYGVAVLDAEPAAASYTGSDTVPWSGARTAGSAAVQGNMLHGAEVVEATYRAFHAEPEPAHCRPGLAERLMRALEAGAAQGGDNRCPKERAALTAFLTVSRPDDSADAPSLYLVAPRAFGLLGALRHALFPYAPSEATPPAVRQLRGMYERWLETHPDWRRDCAQGQER